MKASELIEQLQRLVAMHGDLPVVDGYNKEACDPEAVDDEVIVIEFDD